MEALTTGQCKRMVHTDQEGLWCALHSVCISLDALVEGLQSAHRKRRGYNVLKLCALLERAGERVAASLLPLSLS